MLTIPPTAPFEGPQKMWLKGYLDALSSALARSSSAAPPTTTHHPSPRGMPVTIAWGSQTGTAESLGRRLAKLLHDRGHRPQLRDMAELTPADLPSLGILLIITSTFGDGEPPDNALSLYSALHSSDAPEMSALRFSVLALGDSSYTEFCKCGRDFDQRLSCLGATRIAPLVECDVETEEGFGHWWEQLDRALVAV